MLPGSPWRPERPRSWLSIRRDSCARRVDPCQRTSTMMKKTTPHGAFAVRFVPAPELSCNPKLTSSQPARPPTWSRTSQRAKTCQRPFALQQQAWPGNGTFRPSSTQELGRDTRCRPREEQSAQKKGGGNWRCGCGSHGARCRQRAGPPAPPRPSSPRPSPSCTPPPPAADVHDEDTSACASPCQYSIFT